MMNLFNFKNPEDILYRISRDYIQYTNYGLINDDGGAVSDGMMCAEANNYLELFSLADLPVPAERLKFLEIGCGFGYGSQLINSIFNPESILAIDLAPNAIYYANNKWESPNVAYENRKFSRQTAAMDSIDLIFTVESGGDFPDDGAFRDAYGMLKKGGVFLVASINPIEEINRKKEFARAAGFEIYREKDVTGMVLSYLKSKIKSRVFYSTLEKLPLPYYILCLLFMDRLKDLTRMPGSATIDRLGTSEFYYHFCFRKR